jgi:hypothetical protein
MTFAVMANGGQIDEYMRTNTANDMPRKRSI